MFNSGRGCLSNNVEVKLRLYSNSILTHVIDVNFTEKICI